MSNQGGKTIFLILAVISMGFFCWQKAWANQNLIINEIMYDLAGADDKHEWIEIYNAGTEAIDLTGWKFNDGDNATNHILNAPPKNGSRGTMIIPAGDFALLAGDAETLVLDLPNYGGTIIDTVMSLSNVSAQLKLLNAEGAEVAVISYDKNLGANGNGKTLEWDDAALALRESLLEGGTAGAVNSVLSPAPAPTEPTVPTPTPTPDEAASSTEQTTNPSDLPLSGEQVGDGQKINFGDVVINEIIADPGDNEVEWIELYNVKGGEIDLSGWRLEEGSKARTKLSGSLAASEAGRFKVVEKPAGNLNNAGDIIILYDASGKIIDQVAYGNWDDGNLADNAPAVHDPASLARKYDGFNTYNNSNDFAATSQPTKGSNNAIQAEDEASPESRADFDFSNNIYIAEFLPNPLGDDAKNEFIEIYNAGARAVNLTGWGLSNEGGKKVLLEKIATSVMISAGEYLALYRPKTKIVLHNDQGEVKLYQPLADKAWQAVKYKDVKEGWSYVNTNLSELKANLANNDNWVWSEMPTPGMANIIKTINHAPEVEFNFPADVLVGRPVVFDSSDTNDADGDELKFNWDFGDGFKNSLVNPEHTFFQAGVYQVKLAVSDGKESAEKDKSLIVMASTTVLVLGEKIQTPDRSSSPPLPRGVIINEILPNPAGADTGQEWVELKNQGLDKVNLLNWRLKNSNGQYKFKDDLWLDSENFKLLSNVVSKLALKNSSDVLSLYSDSDELIDRAEYAEAVQGEAYARGENGKWFWTTKLTPGEENIISVAGSQGIRNQELGIRENAAGYEEVALEAVRDMELGSLLKVEGAVAVEPGILGAQIFYIVARSAATSSSAEAAAPANQFSMALAAESSDVGGGAGARRITEAAGLQIYNYKKDFPALKIGDEVEISGELAQAWGELRLKTKDKNDISIKKHNIALGVLALACDQLSEENVGQLISVSGEITSKKSSTIYLDDGSDEILVYFKKTAGLSSKNLAAGQAVAVTGILSKTATGLRLLPRYQTDIVKTGQAGELEPQVLGEVATASEWAVAQRDKKMELFKYLLIVAGGVIMVLVGLFVRLARKK
jgi:PKD repeat protein